ncbi:MAG: ABC transporter permease, partial [Bacillota bacterium]|nr:ABC transporter permease [Bacillota bacterium]
MNGNLWKIAFSLLLRRRRALLILMAGITLSVSLVCTLVVSAMSLVMTMTEQWSQMLGAQDALLVHVDKDSYLRAEERYNPDGLYRIDLVGAVLADDRKQMDDKAIVIGSVDTEGAQIIRVLPEEGRMPEAGGEIVLERNALLRLDRQGRLGDVLSLPVRSITAEGLSAQFQQMTFVVVGILPNRSRLRNGHLGGLSGPGWPNAYVSQTDAAEAAVCHVIISDPAVYDMEHDSPVQQAIAELLESNTLAGLHANQANRAFSIINMLGGLQPQSDGGYASEGNPVAVWLIVPLVLVLMLACGIAGAFVADLRGRRRQLALMRAIGATRRQVILMTVEQAVLVFLPAAPAGVLLSYALTGGMLRIVGTAFGMTVVIWRSWPVMLAALALSLLVSLASALAPAVRLSRLAPVQAVARQQTGERLRPVVRRLPAYTHRIALRLTRKQLKSHLGSLLAGALVMGLCMAACTAVWTFSAAYAKYNWLPESDYWLSDDLARYPGNSVAGLPVSGFREPALEKADFAEMAALPGIGQCQVVAYLYDPILLLDPEKDSPYVRQMVAHAKRSQEGRKGQAEQSAHDLLQISQETLIATIDVIALDDASLRRLISSASLTGSADLEAMRRGEAVLACLPPTVYQVMTQTQGDQTWQTIYYGSDPEKGEPVANTTLAPGDLLHLVKLYAPAKATSGSLTGADVTLKELKAELTGLLDQADIQRQIKVSTPTVFLHLD